MCSNRGFWGPGGSEAQVREVKPQIGPLSPEIGPFCLVDRKMSFLLPTVVRHMMANPCCFVLSILLFPLYSLIPCGSGIRCLLLALTADGFANCAAAAFSRQNSCGYPRVRQETKGEIWGLCRLGESTLVTEQVLKRGHLIIGMDSSAKFGDWDCCGE